MVISDEAAQVGAARTFDRMYRANRKLLWVICGFSGLVLLAIVATLLLLSLGQSRISARLDRCVCLAGEAPP